MLSISAVMPAYNEEDNVGSMIEAMVATIAPLTDDCLNEIHKLLSLINEADLVVGYRSPRRDPFMRKLNAFRWQLGIEQIQ